MGHWDFFWQKREKKEEGTASILHNSSSVKECGGKEEDYEQVVSARLRSCDKSATFLIDVGEKVSGIERGRRRRRVV